MKIGIVTQSYYPRFGGVTEHVHHTAAELRAMGHDVTIVTSHFRREGPPLDAVERIGRNLLVPFNGAFVDVAVGPRLHRRLEECFRQHAFDVVHIHSPAAPTLPLLALTAATCPKVGTFHMTGESRLPHALRARIAERLEHLAARIAVSPVAQRCAAELFGGTYHLVPNGIDVERFHPDRAPFPEWRSRDKVNVLFVGRLDPRKGTHLLITAWSEVVQRTRGRARLLIVGDSYLRRHFEASVPAAVRPHVVFLGAVSAAELPRWYATADLFVAPATGNESFGIVLLEAMASARAVVCADIPGYRATVLGGTSALLHAPGDIASLRDAICELVDDRSQRERLGANGRRRALEFAWPKVAANIAALYQGCLDRHHVQRPAA